LFRRAARTGYFAELAPFGRSNRPQNYARPMGKSTSKAGKFFILELIN